MESDQIFVSGILLWWLTQLLPLIGAAEATPGMLLTGLRLTDEGGARVGLGRLLVRAPMLVVMLLTFQYRPDGAGLLLHDRLSRSRVGVRLR